MSTLYTEGNKKTRYQTDMLTKAENFSFLNETYCKKGQTVLFGDSITEIFNTVEFFQAYTETTGQLVYNRGISRDTSDRLLERLESNVLNIEPRNLAILIGTNDIERGLTREETIENVRTILKNVRAFCPNTHIVLEGIYPVNHTLSLEAMQMVGKRTNKEIGEINAILKEVAETYNAFWLDMTPFLANKRGALRKDLCFDGLHLNAKGFQIVADKLIPLFK